MKPEREKLIRAHADNCGGPIELETKNCDSDGCTSIMKELIAEIDALREELRVMENKRHDIELLRIQETMGMVNRVQNLTHERDRLKDDRTFLAHHCDYWITRHRNLKSALKLIDSDIAKKAINLDDELDKEIR